MARAVQPRTLAEHPNAAVVRDVVTRIPQVSDHDLERLAGVWRDSLEIATARAAALGVDAPLVLEALAVFDTIAEVFADDLAGKPWGAPLQRSIVRLALKAVRDAVAAAYARPALSRRQYELLMAPWQRVFPEPGDGRPALGPRGAEVERVLGWLAVLADRCHEPLAAADFERLHAMALTRDGDVVGRAREEAWSAAQLTGRRRSRILLSRWAREALTRRCPSCGRTPQDAAAAQRVSGLVSDGLWGLLVADALDVTTLEVLVLPLASQLDLDAA